LMNKIIDYKKNIADESLNKNESLKF